MLFVNKLSKELLVLIMLSVAFAAPAGAQFVQTSPGVFQSANGKAKIVTGHTVPGLFILFGPPIALQLFDPALIDLADEGGAPYGHLFLQYDPTVDRYSTLHLGSQQFRIKGGFTILMKDDGQLLRLTVDNNNPYFSIVLDEATPRQVQPATAPSIIGFRGLDPVVNKTGQQPVALLEANQFNQFRGIIAPYEYRTGSLFVKGEKLLGTSLGVELEPEKNICIKSTTAFLSETEIRKLRDKLSKEELIEELGKDLESPPLKDPFKGLLLLRIEPTEVVALDYALNMVKVFRPLKSTSRQVCVIEDIPLD